MELSLELGLSLKSIAQLLLYSDNHLSHFLIHSCIFTDFNISNPSTADLFMYFSY